MRCQRWLGSGTQSRQKSSLLQFVYHDNKNTIFLPKETNAEGTEKLELFLYTELHLGAFQHSIIML
jgi:hypothetical protein